MASWQRQLDALSPSLSFSLFPSAYQLCFSDAPPPFLSFQVADFGLSKFTPSGTNSQAFLATTLAGSQGCVTP